MSAHELKLGPTDISRFLADGTLPTHSDAPAKPVVDVFAGVRGGDDPRDFVKNLAAKVREVGTPFTIASADTEENRKKLTDWLIASKEGVYLILMSPEYEERDFFNQVKDAVAFSDFQREKDTAEADWFLRRITLEVWLREFVDTKTQSEEPDSETSSATEEATAEEATAEEVPAKLDTEPNAGKNLDIEVDGQVYRRFPLRTKNVEREDSLESVVTERLTEFAESTKDYEPDWKNKKWQLFISEKIVAITQSRSFYVWEIEPGWWARKLSARITPSSYGYGLSIPWTMQLAINEVGLPRILLASAGSVLGKLVGKAGVFYMIAGAGVRAIDGPLESPVYPSFLSAKLAPSNTHKAAKKVEDAIRRALPKDVTKNFAGVVIIDANDVGRHILGKSSNEKDATLEAIFEDNPLGQGGERTPVCVVASL